MATDVKTHPSRGRLGRTVVTLAILAISLCLPLRAMQGGGALPSFQLVAPDGSLVASTAFQLPDRLLFVYVTPDSPAAGRLLAALGRWANPQLITRTVLIVGAELAPARTFIDQQVPPELRGIRWYADPGASAGTALRVSGPLALIGLRNGRIEWTVAGVLNDPALVESIVRNWVGL